jgi:phage terminase large subunit
VYSAFDREKHIIKRNEVLPLIAHSAVYTGHDFGGKDPTTCVWIAAHQNKYYIFREYFSDKPTATIKDHTEFINRQTEPVMRRFSDHYTETVNTYKQYGVGLTLADKGPGSLKMGIATVNQLFADDRLFVSEDCKNVIRELESNEWRPLKDEPKPGNDHTLDALRYVLFEIAGKNRGFKSYFATDSTDTSHLSTPKEDPTLIQHLKKAQENNLVLIGYEQNGTPIFAQGT